MTEKARVFAAAISLLIAALTAAPAFAQKPGGVLKVHHQDSPASMSIHEEATYSTVVRLWVCTTTSSSTSRTSRRTA